MLAMDALNDQLHRCLQADGPFATLYLPTPSRDPDAARDATLRWKNFRRELAAAGADEATLAAIDGAVGVDRSAVTAGVRPDPTNTAPGPTIDALADHAGGQALVVVAAGGDVLLRRAIADDVGTGAARFGSLPWLVPMIGAEQVQTAYLVVMLDRKGAEIWGVGADGDSVDGEIDGDDWPIHRVQSGGWSQRRLQQRAINTWEANATEVADEVAKLALRRGVERVLVAGEEQSVSAFLSAAPGSLRPLLHRMEHGARDERGNAEQVAVEVDGLVRSAEAEKTVAVVERLRSRLGSGRAVLGPERVVTALRRGLVEVLLVHDEVLDDRPGWVGPAATDIALDDTTLRELGVSNPVQTRLVDACVRSAVLLGGSVRVVPGAVLDQGVGALLRGELPSD